LELTPDIEKLGFCLADMKDTDIDDFIRVDKMTLQKYIDEYTDFFGGGYKREIGAASFRQKRKLTFFKKLLLKDEIVGFLNYDQRDDKIDNISIRLIEKAQRKGIGTLFISHLIKISKEFCIPVYIEAIKTNPVQKLYKRSGFEFYKEEDIIYFFVYKPNII